MQIYLKNNSIKDIMRVYFNHPAWKMKWGDPIPDMPLDVQLGLVNWCNLKCESCPAIKQVRPKSLLTWEILQKIVDEAANEGVCYFTICGPGEATLHPHLFKLLKYIRDKRVEPKGMRVLNMMPTLLVSNAIWDKQQVKKCIESPPDLLSISLAGLTYEEIIQRRFPINLRKFYDNIEEIYQQRQNQKPIIHISTHIYPFEMRTRLEDIEKFKEKWFKICDAIVIKPTMLDEHHQEFQMYLDEHPNISKTHFERTAPCMHTSRRLSIDSDGNIWCGHHNPEDFGTFLGNIYKQSLREIWHSEKMNQFRIEVRAGIFKRRGCKLCGGEIRDWNRKPIKQQEEKITYNNNFYTN